MPETAILNGNNLPDSMSVAVVMECRPSSNVWLDEIWSVSGVTGDTQSGGSQPGSVRVINEQKDIRQLLYSGFNITLHVDECESYYHNLKAPEPGCYVIARNNSDEVPIPFLVSLSFDEANAYMECEDTVFTVPMSAELYRWTEQFVLLNYVPEKRVKRKRNNWKNAGNEKQGYRT